jgi:hypothetical protein
MKKATLQAIYDVLSMREMEGMVSPDVLAELNKEISKGADEKAARDAVYESVHELVVDNLSSTPITCADLWTEIESEATAKGMTRSKLQYALTNLWHDEITKIVGKPNTYCRK